MACISIAAFVFGNQTTHC